MENWEDILTGYLEGLESRADAESLRWKIHLAAEVREEVEAVLRLADEVAAAVGSVPATEGAAARLQQTLRGQGDWNGRPVPASWTYVAGEGEQARGGFEYSPLSAGAAAGEDAVNAWIEGTTEGTAPAVQSIASAEDEELVGRLEHVRSLTASLSEQTLRPPAGAVDRLRSSFRQDVEEAGVASDEEAARQFLMRLKAGSPRRAELPVAPDVLAASAESGEALGGGVRDVAQPKTHEGDATGREADSANPGPLSGAGE